ncbi:MAG TPA: nitrite reductase small subunit NirD [Acidimicrobiales bacterium]|jgi:nitrite reductase (NADH) small subunit
MTTTWQPACSVTRLAPDLGVCARVDGVPVALFRTTDGSVYALSNIDPFTGASVLSRGIVGDHGGIPTVASPLHKQRFDLRTGRCLDDDMVGVPTYEVRTQRDQIEVRRSATDGNGSATR